MTLVWPIYYSVVAFFTANISEDIDSMHYLEIATYTILGGIGTLGLLYLLRKWFDGGWCYSDIQLDGKTAIVTGCNTGIGKETVCDFVKRGARVIMACRNLEKANTAAKEIQERGYRGEVVVYLLDLSSLDSIYTFSDKVLADENRIDILVNNAGVYSSSKETTKDGFDLTFGTNYIGHFLLTNLLLDKIKESAPSRIVNVSSEFYRFARMDWEDLNFEKPGSYSGFRAYARSKLAILLFTKELASRLEGTGVTVYGLNPGSVATEITRDVPVILRKLFDFVGLLFRKSPLQGAQTTIYCSVSEDVAKDSGLYYSDCAKRRLNRLASDLEAALKLWDMTYNMISLKQSN